MSPCFDLKWTCKTTDCYNIEPNDKQVKNLRKDC